MRPAFLALALAMISAPALSEEAIVDGIRYRVPEGTGFFLPPPHGGFVDAKNVQRILDRNRAEGPDRDGARTLFTSVAIPGKPFMGLLLEPDAKHPGSVRRERMRSLPLIDGVATVPVDLLPPGDGPVRGYFVRTGLDYAPEAVVSCKQEEGTCFMSVTLDKRLLLVLRGFPFDDANPASMRASVTGAVQATLPGGMRRVDGI